MDRETFKDFISKGKKLMEWTEAGKEKPPDEAILDRIKDNAESPSVGDKIKIEFDRPHLTRRQKELDGAKGTVEIRESFRTGSQYARYSVEIEPSETESGNPQMVHNLNPSEVVPVE